MYENTNDASVKLKFFGLPKLRPFLHPYRFIICSMVIMGLVGSLMDIVTPLFFSYALDHFIMKETLEGLGAFIGLYIAAIIISVLTNAVSAYQACQIEMYVGRDMKQKSFDHLQTLSFSYYNQNSVGYIHARVMSDTERIGGWVAWGIMECVWNMTYLGGIIIVMLHLNLRLAMLILLLVPVTTAAAVYFQRRMVALGRKVREINSIITGGYNEGITGARTIKTLVIEDKMQSGFEKVTEEMRKTSVHLAHFRAMFLAVISFSASCALALVLWQGGVITKAGVMEIGVLSVFMSYALGMMEPIQWIIRALSDLVNVQVNIERFTRLMATAAEVGDTPEVVEKYGDSFSPKKENWEPLFGDVEFRDVSFHYPDGEEMIFEHFSLNVPQGTNVAIVGETGAGKSTLVNLLCRFFEPTGGQILIDGRDVRERSQLWLHSHLGYVIQTPHLFSGTIAENLRYAKPDATMEEMEAAMKAVAADSIPERMEDGYDSQVGEGGDLLSTGEKQLISFARAVLADPAIFVLDEATSSIDTVTEKKIQDATAYLLKGRTSFVIAHRLSTIRQADVILMVDGGKIVERGTHEELMAERGAYYELYIRSYKG
ncbi:MAG: ABC transporter ATP-binding protein [Lachnospiraceae bacterium]|nr:ABC transporter ATP-binding protein [Lachnospiraceae bacterium]